MKHTLIIEGISVDTLVGFYERELTEKQPLIISLELTVPSITSDDVAHTVNTSKITKEIIDWAASGHRNLIETVAEELAALVLENYPVYEAKVRVEKPNRKFARLVAVEVVRKKTSKRSSKPKIAA